MTQNICMDEDTLDQLEKLTQDIDTIVFKAPAKKGRLGTRFDIYSKETLIEAVLEGNPKANFDLYGCGSIGYIDENTRYAEYFVGVEVDSDGLSDINSLYEYPNLQRLALNVSSEPYESDIEALQMVLINLPKLKEIVITLSDVSEANSELLQQAIHFSDEDKQVRFSSNSHKKMKIKRSRA